MFSLIYIAVVFQIQADGADEGCVTFVMHDEDHTLGNSLRYMIMKKSVFLSSSK